MKPMIMEPTKRRVTPPTRTPGRSEEGIACIARPGEQSEEGKKCERGKPNDDGS
jgi:hypothetical protein